MAYMSQERKKTLAPNIKKILTKYGLKGTLSVDNHSGLTLNIKSGKIDFIGNTNKKTMDPMNRMPEYRRQEIYHYIQVNVYHLDNSFTGKALSALKELRAAMNVGNHDNSDAMTDYFDVGWYVYINVGKWNRPYELTK